MTSPAIDCVVQSADVLGEMPLWCDRTQRLWWIDVRRPALESYDPASGRHTAQRLPEHLQVGGLALREDGGFLLGTDAGLLSFQPESLKPPARIADPEVGKPRMRLNDGRCDRRGRYWIGSMFDGPRAPVGSLFCIGPGAEVRTVLSDLYLPNSICWSPDDRVMYLSDTFRRVTWAFDFDVDDGQLSNQRVLRQWQEAEGRPDGAVVDAEGCIWICMVEGGVVLRIAPDGRTDRSIRMPVTHPTCPAFGGSGLATLFVTSHSQRMSPEQLAREPLSGGIFALDVGVPGVPETRFMP